MTMASPSDILIGPRTTVFALLDTYPFLESMLVERELGFEALARPRARSRWARVITLEDIALRRNVTWRQVVREITAEVTRVTGRPTRDAITHLRVAGDDLRLGELREIVAGLEGGASLFEMAERWRAVTGDLEPAEAAALDKALAAEAGGAAGGGNHLFGAAEPPAGASPAGDPEGHPLDTLRREAARLGQLCVDLRRELDRLGGSPTRRRWRLEKQLVARLVDRMGGVESRFRRLQQAWFPALGVHGVSGPQALLGERQAEALEMLRRLRLAVAGDDAASVAESGARLVDVLGYLLTQDEHLVEPLAERYFSRGDWVAVRELEEGVGWLLVTPPPWPPARSPEAGAAG